MVNRLWLEFRSALRPVPIMLALMISLELTGLQTVMSSFGHVWLRVTFDSSTLVGLFSRELLLR